MKENLLVLRTALQDIGDRVRALLPEDHSEIQANLMLSYRHIEDARMRLGKVIQAREGGVSVYDKRSIEIEAEGSPGPRRPM